jgi:hypothetical protein
VADFAQRRVMRGGGRCGSGEERSAGAASGAAVEGAPLGKAATATGTTPHYTALCECQPSTTRDRPFGGCRLPRRRNEGGGAAAVDRLPRQRLELKRVIPGRLTAYTNNRSIRNPRTDPPPFPWSVG